jgi:hypothetical protein
MVKLQPELLLLETLPPTLASFSPREILGEKWWDKERKAAYAIQEDRCWACGTHKTDKWCSCGDHYAYKTYLEAHENYTIDWVNRRVTFHGVVALCHSCHNFIHNGRLVRQFNSGVNSYSYTANVLSHGVAILTQNGLKPTAQQAISYLMVVKEYTLAEAVEYTISRGLVKSKHSQPEFWYDWAMDINGMDNKLKEERWIYA